MERDPVCGMTVVPDKAAARVEHAGKTYYFCAPGCAQRFAENPEKYLQKVGQPNAHAMVSLPVVGGAPVAKDPVCGMAVDPARAAGRVENDGRTYFFCSTGCAERFKKAPEQFLSSARAVARRQAGRQPASTGPSTGEKPAEQKTIRYTCPMHPEVIRYGPGSCPKCGMALEPLDIVASGTEQPDPEYVSMRNRFWVSAVLSVPITLLGMFGEKLGLAPSGTTRNWIELALAVPVVLWAGWPFFQRFWASLLNRSPNMFTLIGLGTGAAFLDSVVAAVFPRVFPQSLREIDGSVPVYFEAAAVITTL